MKTILTLAMFATLGLGTGATARAEGKCGAHQHEAVEKNDDEGGTVKRCVCDKGWDGAGPTAPCKKAKAGKAGAPAPTSAE